MKNEYAVKYSWKDLWAKRTRKPWIDLLSKGINTECRRICIVSITEVDTSLTIDFNSRPGDLDTVEALY